MAVDTRATGGTTDRMAMAFSLPGGEPGTKVNGEMAVSGRPTLKSRSAGGCRNVRMTTKFYDGAILVSANFGSDDLSTSHSYRIVGQTSAPSERLGTVISGAHLTGPEAVPTLAPAMGAEARVVGLSCLRCRARFEESRLFAGCPRCRAEGVAVNLSV